MKSAATLCRIAITAVCVIAFAAVQAEAATVAWTNGAALTAWYTNTNWTPSTASNQWTTADLAQFNNLGTANTAGINMATAQLSIGAIEATSTRTRVLTIGNSSSTAGTLTLNGTTVSGVANTILRSAIAGSTAANSLFTLQDNETGTGKTMNIALGNVTDNIVQIDGIGNIAINSIISGVGKHITVQGTGAGRLLLAGQNTFTGGVTVKSGATLSANGANSTGAITSGPLGTGSLTIDGGSFIPTSSGINTIANPITLNNVAGNSISVGGGPATLSGSITGGGGFSKSSSGILVLSGANSYSGVTAVSSGTLAFAKTQSFYGGVPANWTDANFAVEAGANLVYAVGGAGEFTFAQFMQQATVGTNTGGFKDLASIGLDTTNGGSQTISTVFTNNNSGVNRLGLVKSGTNTLFLTNANTHGGPTTAAGGTLNLSNLLAVQNSTLTTTTAGAVVFDQAAGGTAFPLGGLGGNGNLALQNNAVTPLALQITLGGNNIDTIYSGNLTGASSASILKVGTGLQAFAGTNSGFSGSVTVNSGTLGINSATAIGTGPLTLNAGAKLDNTSGSAKTLTTNNVQTWNGNFAFVGSSAVSGVGLGTGAVTMTTNIEINTQGVSNANNALTIGGVISDSGNNYGITKVGPGRLVLAGLNTFAGGFTINGGAVHVNDQSSDLANNKGPVGTGTFTLNGGQLIGSSGAAVNTLQNAITLIGPASGNTITTNGTFTLSGVIGGSGGFNKSGNAGSVVILTNANTYSGDTVISLNSGTVTLKHQLAMQNSTYASSSAGTGAVVFDQGVAGNAFTLGGLAGDRNVALVNNAVSPAAIALSLGSNSSTYSGILSGAGSIIKVGAGKTTFTGANSYSGTTTVNGGTLLINAIQPATGAYFVNPGGTLGGTGTITANVLVQGGTLAPGASIESLDIAGGVNIDSGSFDWEFSNGGGLVLQNADVVGADVLNVNGALTIGATAALVGSNLGTVALPNGITFTVISYASGTPGQFAGMADNTTVSVGGQYWTIKYDDAPGINGGSFTHNVTLTSVPEISSILVMSLGGVFAVGAVWLGKRYGVAASL